MISNTKYIDISSNDTNDVAKNYKLLSSSLLSSSLLSSANKEKYIKNNSNIYSQLKDIQSTCESYSTNSLLINDSDSAHSYDIYNEQNDPTEPNDPYEHNIIELPKLFTNMNKNIIKKLQFEDFYKFGEISKQYNILRDSLHRHMIDIGIKDPYKILNILGKKTLIYEKPEEIEKTCKSTLDNAKENLFKSKFNWDIKKFKYYIFILVILLIIALIYMK